jgi:outer membrane lipoprotein-sorting protein
MSFLRRITTRQLLSLCAAAAALVIGGAAIAIAAGAGGPKPPPKRLAVAIHDALAAPAVQGVTARVKFTNHLINSADVQGSNAVLSGATGRLWATRDGHVRIELQSERGDAQLVSDGKRFWAYDGSSNTVYRGRLPQHPKKRSEARKHGIPTVTRIERVLARLGKHLDISGANPDDVASRAAYSVRVAPKQHGGLLGGAGLAWDAARGVPLRLAVYAKGHASPVLELEATDVSFGPVSASAFAISPPAGAKSVDLSPGGHEHASRKALAFKLDAPRNLAGRSRQPVKVGKEAALVTYGRGLDGIAVVERKAKGSAAERSQLPTVSVGSVTGHELETPLGTVVSFERGGVAYTVLGSVPRAVVEAAARGL